MWNWIVRFLGGIIPGQKPFGEWIGKILYVVVIVLGMSLVTNLWDKFFPQKPNVINVAGNYTSTQSEPMVAHFGCSAWRANMRVWYAR